jgi:hypothetical protein
MVWGRQASTLLFVTAAVTSACAARVFPMPTAAGLPAPEAATAWRQATEACRDARNASVTLRVAVREGRRRSPSLALSVGVTSAGHIRLDGPPMFLLAGTAARATLWLREENRIVTARAEEIVDAFIGVRLGPERLLAVLTGCLSARPSEPIRSGARHDKMLDLDLADGRAFLERQDGRWRVVAGVVDGAMIEYRGFLGYWPGEWLAESAELRAASRQLNVRVTDIQVNDADIDRHPEAFQLAPAAGATPMTLDELRAAGVLRQGR